MAAHAIAYLSLAACGPAGARTAEPSPLARAVRALRGAVVGDHRLGTPDGARAARHPAPARPPSGSRAEALPPATPFDTAEWPSVVIPFTSTTADPRTAWTGDTLALPAPAPPAGTPGAIARDLRWTSTDPAVATVSADGVVSARVAGTTEVVAWRRVGETVTPLVVRPAVRGRVVAADGVTLRARVVVQWPGSADTVRTDADGAFVLRLRGALASPVSVRIEPDDASHADALLAGATAAELADLDVVLLPTSWHLSAGSYAGQTVPIRPAIAQGRARDGLRFWRVARPARDGARDAGQAVGWAAARLPLAVAFDAGSRGAAIGPADSAAFWRTARQLERDWGTPLFRAVPRASSDPAGFVGILVTVDARLRAAGLTTTGSSGTGEISDALVAVQSRALLADPQVVTHELLHALGIGHAGASWTSVMHPTAEATSGDHASLEDVAYGQLLYAVRARSRGRGTPVGIAEAAAAAPDR